MWRKWTSFFVSCSVFVLSFGSVKEVMKESTSLTTDLQHTARHASLRPGKIQTVSLSKPSWRYHRTGNAFNDHFHSSAPSVRGYLCTMSLDTMITSTPYRLQYGVTCLPWGLVWFNDFDRKGIWRWKDQWPEFSIFILSFWSGMKTVTIKD